MKQFNSDQIAKFHQIVSRYPEGKQKSALIPTLLLAQDSFDNWLSVDTMDYVAQLLQLQPIEVYEVASFYSMFNLKPVGKYVFEVCQTGPCMIEGSEKILSYIKQKLGIEIGQTTSDGLFTLKVVECLGACGYAPMMQFGKTYREHLTPQKIDDIINQLKPA
ncbi:MAG: NAD(P)H-dependent oxidoreductase subunit E [Sediminibacterium sp.]|nr:NAD(P)H-dependent oxidoreductase subunit E [Sediminibacterium sp.]